MASLLENSLDQKSLDFDVIVVGGSLPAIVGALLVKKRNPEMVVALVEGASSLGGNLLGVDVMGDHFENGTHILQEIGDAEVDAIIESAVDKEHLVQLDSSVGDIAGTVKDGKVWELTGYPDVLGQDSLLASRIMRHIADLKNSNIGIAKEKVNVRTLDFESAAVERFGVHATNHVLLPIVQRLFGRTEDLSGFAMELCNLTRLRLVDESTWKDDIPRLGLRDTVAYPNQRSLPLIYKHNKKSLYSSHRGAIDFVDGLAEICRALSVDVALNTKVLKIDLARKSAVLETDGIKKAANFRHLLSCVGVTATNVLIDGARPKDRRRLKYRIVHLVLKSPMNSDMCYLYSHDVDSVMFRVTNYRAFSKRNGDTRVTVEVIGADHLPDEFLVKEIEQELIRSQLIEEGSIKESICLNNLYGYPIPTVETFQQFELDDLRLRQYEQSGLVTCGLGVTGGLFFQNEILIDVVSKVRTIF
jgi:protoporphyrinogen oxidase